MSRMFCKICGVEMVASERVVGDPALDCGGDCRGCVAPLEQAEETVIDRSAYPDIYDDIALVYGWATAPIDDMPNRVEARDLLPLAETPDGTPI